MGAAGSVSVVGARLSSAPAKLSHRSLVSGSSSEAGADPIALARLRAGSHGLSLVVAIATLPVLHLPGAIGLLATV